MVFCNEYSCLSEMLGSQKRRRWSNQAIFSPLKAAEQDSSVDRIIGGDRVVDEGAAGLLAKLVDAGAQYPYLFLDLCRCGNSDLRVPAYSGDGRAAADGETVSKAFGDGDAFHRPNG